MNELQKGILRTIAYSDIFDFPLTEEEIFRYYIGEKGIKGIQIKGIKGINKKNNYFFLKGREEIVEKRVKREKWAKEKFGKAQKAARWLAKIPTVIMVGVTGSLAVGNVKEDDDIDLIIITSARKMWLTRLFCVLLMEVLGQRRRPKERQVKDKICLNIFLDRDNLEILKEQQNLFIAHEIAQIKCLVNKDQVFEYFLAKNTWIHKYLPNIKTKKTEGKDNNRGENIFENLAYFIQIKKMAANRTREKINPGQAFFHPSDVTERILSKYNLKLKVLGIN